MSPWLKKKVKCPVLVWSNFTIKLAIIQWIENFIKKSSQALHAVEKIYLVINMNFFIKLKHIIFKFPIWKNRNNLRI